MEKSTKENNDGIPIGDLTVKEKEPTIEEIIEECGVGSTILMYHVKKGDIEKVALILEQCENIDARDSIGNTALSIAVYSHPMELDIAELLLKKGANINNTCNKLWSPLMLACAEFVPEKVDTIPLVELFLDNGANIHNTSEIYQTATMIASVFGSKKIVQTLISKGANINTKDINGKTATILAFEQGYLEIVEVLEKWPATMAIIVLQKLLCNDCCGDLSNLCDLIQFLGKEYNYIEFFEDEEEVEEQFNGPIYYQEIVFNPAYISPDFDEDEEEVEGGEEVEEDV